MTFLKRLTNGAGKGHDDLLSEGIDGWVGDLGKQLLEVIVDQGAHLRKAGKGGVVAHRAQGFLLRLEHRYHQHLESFNRVP